MSEAHVQTMGGSITVGESNQGRVIHRYHPWCLCHADPIDGSAEAAQTSTFDAWPLLLDDLRTSPSMRMRSLGFDVTTAIQAARQLSFEQTILLT